MSEGKICAKCVEWKPFLEFSKQKKMKDGHHSYCKICYKNYRLKNIESIKEKDKIYRMKNREHLNQKSKKYAEKNADSIREYKKRYYQKNAETIKERTRKNQKENIEYKRQKDRDYYKNNSDTVKQRVKKWVQENKEARRQIAWRGNVKRRSYKYHVNFTKLDRKRILDRDDWVCQCCGIDVHDKSGANWNTHDKAHIDHIIPISKGGDSKPYNLRTLCRTCNLTKSNKEDEQLELQIKNPLLPTMDTNEK